MLQMVLKIRISLKDLKEFPLINATLGRKEIFLNKKIQMGINNTNITSLGFDDNLTIKSNVK